MCIFLNLDTKSVKLCEKSYVKAFMKVYERELPTMYERGIVTSLAMHENTVYFLLKDGFHYLRLFETINDKC